MFDLYPDGASIQKKIDLLFDWVDAHFRAGNFEIVDQYLAQLDESTLDSNLCVAVLTITFAAKEKLANRPDAVRRIRDRLTELAPDRVERLLVGLD